MKQPACYVIAHRGSRAITECVQSLVQHHWQFEVVTAVNGSRLTTSEWANIGIRMSDQGKISKRPGAQGCWHSHYHLWRKCLDKQEPIVILEHDAVVSGPWPEDLIIDKELVKLYKSAPCKEHPVYGTWSKGSHAYTLTPEQAQQLIEFAQKNNAQAVDKHLGTNVLPWRFLDSDLVVLSKIRGPSTTSQLNSFAKRI